MTPTTFTTLDSLFRDVDPMTTVAYEALFFKPTLTGYECGTVSGFDRNGKPEKQYHIRITNQQMDILSKDVELQPLSEVTLRHPVLGKIKRSSWKIYDGEQETGDVEEWYIETIRRKYQAEARRRKLRLLAA